MLSSTAATADEGHWSLKPLIEPPIPATGSHSPIDAYVEEQLRENGLRLSPPADRRSWLRRVYFDLIGLPPSPEEMQAFLRDGSTKAREHVVDRLLASPRYGERWARHWMDVARYAETHGHDEDAIRENAWPYRDWLIRAFNADKPYADFVREQIAGDVIAPADSWSVAATGFLGCGPWDESSQMGIQDGTTDKKIAQYLDRDDMLSATMLAFNSTTAHCARCHDHKFDPVSLRDYYALQAVFAGIDKAERPFEPDPDIARERRELQQRKRLLDDGTFPDTLLDAPEMQAAVTGWEQRLGRQATQWQVVMPATIVSASGVPHAVQADGSILFGGEAPATETLTISGNPVSARVTAVQVETLADPSLPMGGPGRAPNGNLHLSEFTLRVAGRKVPVRSATADFDQADWEVDKAIDGRPETAWGIHPQEGRSHHAVFVLADPLEIPGEAAMEFTLEQLHGGSHVIGRLRISVSSAPAPMASAPLPPDIAALLQIPGHERTQAQRRTVARTYLQQDTARRIAALPEPGKVYAVTSSFPAKGNFMPAVMPRDVRVLQRGDVLSPLEPAAPGALSCIPGLPGRFGHVDPADEGGRRAALADWLAHHDNVLTWRSIANRVWHYHFGRGIVDTPNDFGKMGAAPTHPELLDWLAARLRDHDGSLKWLHRTIVLSATYGQAAADHPAGLAVDPENRLLWRMNRRRLDAECIRDAVLSLSGMLDLEMGGPSARHFHTRPGVHVTPVVDYASFDPDDPANFRRGVYRFVFRTVPDPLMQALDCPDASQLAPRREASSTALQALAMLNNRFMVRQASHIASDLQLQNPSSVDAQVSALFQRAYGRPPRPEEHRQVTAYAREFGLANACRVVINSSEFLFLQ